MSAEPMQPRAGLQDLTPLEGGTPLAGGTPRVGWSVSPALLALAGVVAVGAVLHLGASPSGVVAAGSLGVLVVLSGIDLQARVLPNAIVLPATAAVLCAQAVARPERLLESVLAALAAAAIVFAPNLLDPAAMGMGDVKLAGFLGVLLGFAAIPALMIGLLATAPALAVLLALRGRDARRAAIPLGPFLAFGAAVVLLTGPA